MSPEQNQGWANAAPFAILSVAVLVACFGGFRAGYVPASSAPLMVGVLIACFLPQLVGGIIAFKRGEVLLGTICGLFGTTITLGAAFTLWIQIFAAPAVPGLHPADYGVLLDYPFHYHRDLCHRLRADELVFDAGNS